MASVVALVLAIASLPLSAPGVPAGVVVAGEIVQEALELDEATVTSTDSAVGFDHSPSASVLVEPSGQTMTVLWPWRRA